MSIKNFISLFFLVLIYSIVVFSLILFELQRPNALLRILVHSILMTAIYNRSLIRFVII